MGLVEAILEDPTIVLRKQRDKARSRAVQKMKEEGYTFEERQERVQYIDYPQPNKEFILVLSGLRREAWAWAWGSQGPEADAREQGHSGRASVGGRGGLGSGHALEVGGKASLRPQRPTNRVATATPSASQTSFPTTSSCFGNCNPPSDH